MECPSCKADIPECNRFCDECGAPVPMPCPACGTPNRPGATFCGKCGGRLTTSSSGTSATASRPKPLSEFSRAKPEGERRQLTVMFCDLVDSTALAATMDPEDLRDVIGAYQRRVEKTVTRFGGFVAKYMGDGVLVYFGYPQAHENDAERAVRAGLKLVEKMAGLKRAETSALHVRVGIATGLVVVGDLVGSGASQEQAVVGETPNLAARLQMLAEPNTVVIADSTHRLVGSLFEYRDPSTTMLKGFAQPVQAWQVTRTSNVASRFEALRSGALTPLVGRAEEIELLMRRWQQAKTGEGRVVLLSGEPGIGKSRITDTILERIASEPHTRLRYFCSPHHTDSALHPVINQLERAAEFEREDDGAIKLNKLDALLSRTSTAAEDGWLIAEFLSLPSTERFLPLDLSPQRRKEKTLDALVRQLDALAHRQPILMVFEDVHWIDPTSLELLDRTVERVQRLRMLLVATFRPEFVPPWTGQPHVTVLALNRLGSRECAALVEQIMGNKTLPNEVIQEIVKRTDGVPLFVEELTKAVVERDAHDDDSRRSASQTTLAVPATLHASLMARLDRLGPAVKEVAQIGAAIGREFSFELLSAVAHREEAGLHGCIRGLAEAGLILQRGTLPNAVITFKHALVQDAAYGTLLRGKRHELHARIARALELQVPQMVERHPELLAHHCAEAGLLERAIHLWTLSGQQALARAANREASMLFERALMVLKAQEALPATMTRIIDVRRIMHQALITTGELHRDRGNLEEAERLAEQLGDDMRLSRVLSNKTYLLASIGDVSNAIESGERALRLAISQDDLEANTVTRLTLARAFYAGGRYREAIAYGQEVITSLGEDVQRGSFFIGGLNQTVSARVWLALCHAELGEFEEGTARGKEAMRLTARLGNSESEYEQLWSRLGLGRLYVVQGNFTSAIELLEPALLLCEKPDFAVFFQRIACSLGVAYAKADRIEVGLALLRRAVSQSRGIGFVFGRALALSQLGEALLLAGDSEQARATGLAAIETARGSGEQGNQAWALRLLGDVAAVQGDHAEARAHYREALVIAEQRGMVPVKALCLEGLVGIVSAESHSQ
jgi:class 3 adenylate cyclase/tetratricopeptide (TPR) repeat protein